MMEENVIVPIELTRLLREFSSGSITIHLDDDGEIRKIETHRIEFKK